MENKHTPGPWEFLNEPDGISETIIEHEGCPIATVRGTDDMSCIDEEDEEKIASESVATAKLIAAAPEMLDALSLFQSGFDHFLKCANLKESFLDAEAITWMNEIGIKSTEAIKKATG